MIEEAAGYEAKSMADEKRKSTALISVKLILQNLSKNEAHVAFSTLIPKRTAQLHPKALFN